MLQSEAARANLLGEVFTALLKDAQGSDSDSDGLLSSIGGFIGSLFGQD